MSALWNWAKNRSADSLTLAASTPIPVGAGATSERGLSAPYDQEAGDDLIHIVWKDRPHKTLCGIPVGEYDVVPGGPQGAPDECIVCVDLDRVAGEWV